MENKINIAELLRDCPTGMELDCLLYDEVIFEEIEDDIEYPIVIRTKEGETLNLTSTGCWDNNPSAKCVIFPKGKTTWEGFVPPCQFKDGDILFVEAIYDWIVIYKENENQDDLYKYVATPNYANHTYIVYDNNPLCCRKDATKIRFATKEEKEKLFKAIKDRGYKWNAGTKVLEKLVTPKFKVGDRIKTSFNAFQYDITELTDTHYTLVEVEHKFKYTEPIIEDKNWELVYSKFDIDTLKPFESRVLVRDYSYEPWRVSFWGCLLDNELGFKYDTIRGPYKQCIPYEGNEHLLGKTDDCDEFYKTWKK